MSRFVIRRLLFAAPVLFGLSIVVFLYIRVIPGDPVAALLTINQNPTAIANLTHEFGLDRPLVVQYLTWLGGAVHGDLGLTFGSREPIGPLLLSRIPATLELAFAAMFIGCLIAIPGGIYAGTHVESKFDRVYSVLMLAAYSVPAFWTGTILVLILSVNLRVLPSEGYVPFFEDPLNNLKFLLMPALSLGLLFTPLLARMVRAAVIEASQELSVFYARAKGLRPRTVLIRYIVRPAAATVLIAFGLNFAALLSGAIIIEEMFDWPGAGRVIVRAVLERDYYLVQGSILVYATLFILINIGIEVLHAWLDPRVRLT
jgi:peptide/nickel transport system permease protein